MRPTVSIALLSAASAAGLLAITQGRRSPAPTNTSVAAVASVPSTPAAGARKKVGKAARIRGRAEQQLAIERDEFGRIPADALMRAKADMMTLPAVGVSGGLNSAGWTEQGPGNIGGRIRAIAIHPTNNSTIFVGSITGGIWRSTDAGANWARVDDLMGNLAISTIVINPANPSMMYAGTGEQAQGHRGAGVFRSTDGGNSWSRLAATNSADFLWVNRLAISADGATLLCGTGSLDFERSAGGIYRSTDAGVSWTRVDGTSPSVLCRDIKFRPNSSSQVVAEYTDFNATTATVLYSSNGGATWSPANGIGGADDRRVELAWGAGNGTLYGLRDSDMSAIYRSTDSGANWTQVANNTGILGNQGSYDNAIWVDPSDTDTNPNNDVVVAGGISMYRSNDGGQTFTVIGDWQLYPGPSIHADHHAIVQHPLFNGTTNKTVYFGCDGGIFRTDDIYTVSSNGGWVQMNNSLNITQFYGASRHAGTDIVYGGTQDNGVLRRNTASGINGWTSAVGGDGGYSASDPNDSNYHYGEYVYGQVSRSANGGLLGEDIWGGGKGAPYEILEAGASQGNFIAPFVLDPNDSNRLLVGLMSLWRSNDVKAALTPTTGPQWATIKQPAQDAISAVTVQPGNAAVIYVGHNNGEVYKTTNGTATNPTWNLISTGLPGRYVTRVTVDPTNANTIYVSLGGYVAGNIYKSTTGGGSWTMINTPAVPVRDVDVNANQPSWLYAATDVGLIVSEDGGANWSSAASPSDVRIDETFFSAGRLYLATHGRGIFYQEPSLATMTSKGTTCALGFGSPGGPSMTASAPVINGISTFTLSSAPLASQLFLGVEQNPPLPFQSCLVYINPVAILSVGSFAGTTLPVPIPNNPSMAGQELAFQAVVVVGGQGHLTNALIARFGF